MPQSIQNNFETELKSIITTDRISSLRNYYDSLIKSIYDIDYEKEMRYQSIHDRLLTTRYFYFPTESRARDMNCFERNATMYIAFHELYPESNPSLITTTDDYNNVHASVLFTHNDKLWGVDVVKGYFGEIQLEYDKIIVPPRQMDEKSKSALEYLSVTDPEKYKSALSEFTAERRLKFKKIQTISGKSLENLVGTLRREPGIIDFLYKSGQNVSYSWSGLVSKHLFMKIEPDGNILSEIRVCGESFSEKDACLRFKYNPLTKKRNMEFLRYSDTNWGTLINPQSEKLWAIGEHNLGSDLDDGNPIMHLKDFIFYINNVNKNVPYAELMDFAKNPVVQNRFDKCIEAAKEIDDSTYIEFLKYLRCRFGPAKNISLTNSRLTIQTRNNVNNIISLDKAIADDQNHIDLELSSDELTHTMNRLMQSLMDSNLIQIPALIKLVDDSKKYTMEASKYILDK